MTQPVRIGIIGVGDVLSAYMSMVSRLQNKGLVRVVAACAPTTRRADAVKSDYGIDWFTTDCQALINSDEIDLILVLSPAQTHGVIAQAALSAGKHVLVEKPLAATLDEAAELVALSHRSPGYLICAPFVVLSPTYQAMWRHVQQNDVGELQSARAMYGWAGPWWSEWFYREGAGAIVDFGVYNFTSLTGFFGPVRRVTALTGIAVPERAVNGREVRVEAEDNAHILLDFGRARFAAITTGFTMQRYRRPAVELYGTQGTLQMLGDDWAPQGYEMWQNAAGAWKVFYEADPFWSWTDGLRHLVDCIQNGKAPLCTPEHAYHVLEVMIRAKESGRDGEAKTVDSVFAPLQIEQSADTRGHPAHLVHDPRGRQP
jgi:predicted dehydrogenase